MAQVFFNKEVECVECGTEYMVVGNVVGESMTTGSDNVIAEEVMVGTIIEPDGATKDDIIFASKCPECGDKRYDNIIR